MFEFSWLGFFLFLWLFGMMIKTVFSATFNVAKTVVKDENAQGIFVSWLSSMFRK